MSSEKAKIKEPVILITINKAYRFGMSPKELYDATRSAWVVNPKRKPKYAMAVFHGIIREVYLISGWIPGGSTMRFSDWLKIKVAHTADFEVSYPQFSCIYRQMSVSF